AVLREAGWPVVEPVDEPSGITTITGGDPFATRTALLEQGILVNAVQRERSPDLTAPVLRISTAAWVEQSDVERLVQGLSTLAKA
ncbi:MAG: csdB, partial [Frankiales bacterium]|nr:csdB [Frankiales bacterium]